MYLTRTGAVGNTYANQTKQDTTYAFLGHCILFYNTYVIQTKTACRI